MRWALDTKDPDASLLLANAYAALCMAHGPLTEGRAWLDEALQTDAGQSRAARAKALCSAGSLAKMQGDLERAREFGEASLSLARSVEEAEDIGRALLLLGIVAEDELDHDRSESLMREALAIFRSSENQHGVRKTLGLLGFDAIARKDYQDARSLLEEAVELSRKADDSSGVLTGVANLWYVFAQQGQLKDALPLLRESVLLAYELSDFLVVTSQLEDVAAVAAELRDYELAAVMLGGAAALLETTGHAFEPVQQEQHEETVAILRLGLEGDRLARSWDRGRKMTLEELVTDAVRFIDSAYRGF
jgi:tetratricopeptide (TPR) repeat protein